MSRRSPALPPGAAQLHAAVVLLLLSLVSISSHGEARAEGGGGSPGSLSWRLNAQAPLGPAESEFAVDPTWTFSDRFPVEVSVLGAVQAGWVVDLGLDVEGVSLPGGPQMPGIVRANINEQERGQVEALGLRVTRVRNESKEAFLRVQEQWARREAAEEGRPDVGGRSEPVRAWPTYAELQAELQAVAEAHPEIVRIHNLGNSVQGRGIWILKITDNPGVEENEPEFKYTSSIHGDEVVGMELCRRLIHLLVDNYGTDPRLTSLVDEAEIWICPMHNPDGFVNGSRYNAHGVDLNRTFPDPVDDPDDNPDGREPEVQHFMYFGYDHNFILSANYHGGALVMNIPWDCKRERTPDHDLIWEIAEGYSYRNPPMWGSSEFYHGVTLGSDWYVIHGGMQDWCYNWRNEIDITIEVGNTKWPNWSQMETFWNNNREAMLWYMERFIGNGGIVKGIITDAVTGLPLGASVNVTQIGKAILSDAQVGDYHRLLRPGTYTLAVSRLGYHTQTIDDVVVTGNAPTVVDVALQPVISGVGLDGPAGVASGLHLSRPSPCPSAGPVELVLRAGDAAAAASGGRPDGEIRAAVFDTRGRLVRNLVVPAAVGDGGRALRWDGRDGQGRRVAPGVYFLRAESGGATARRMVVIAR